MPVRKLAGHTAPTELHVDPVLSGTAIRQTSGRAKAVIAVAALTAAAVMDGLNVIIFDIPGNHMAGYASASPDEAAWLTRAAARAISIF